ncbi:hypothetical protein BRADI_3g28838v3 [Brachypodium distachyon]|uniref:Uncharacterized protein n=1 Tax=Brachypodium distachyon TaxID=15368 RepID=A0A2K2CZU7_BRADI|nr:hypothetical protein BRADI_3g28838v3 [Brachypodium distachyon]
MKIEDLRWPMRDSMAASQQRGGSAVRMFLGGSSGGSMDATSGGGSVVRTSATASQTLEAATASLSRPTLPQGSSSGVGKPNARDVVPKQVCKNMSCEFCDR